jgi:hypothetical protein
MNVENNNTLLKNTGDKFNPDAQFHIALGWLTALSVTVAAIATAA